MKLTIHFYTLDFKIKRGIILKKNISYKSVLAVFLLMYIGSIIFLNNIIADKVFSESENRRLEQAPKFSTSQVVDGRYTTNYEKYITDQFPMRDFWIGVKSSAEKLIGKKENNGVYLGKNDFLLERFQKPEENKFLGKIKEVNDFAKSISNGDIYFILIPGSTEILKENLPAFAPNDSQLEIIEETKELLSHKINFVSIYENLFSHRKNYIYYRTDHHWTTEGAYLVYKDFMNVMNIVPNEKEYFERVKVSDNFYGSLYSKSGFRNISPDSLCLYKAKRDEGIEVEYVEEMKKTNSIYCTENLNKKDKYTVFLDGNHPYIKIKTNFKKDRKLLIIKDSFANSFIPFLTGHFSEIHVIDPRYYKEDMVELIEKENIENILILYSVNTFFKN